MLGSREFASRPVLSKFLSFVVEKALSGQTHEIKEYTVAIEVFGRGENFDGLKDSIVRMQAGRLRRALERYYESLGSDHSVRIEIPKGGYAPIFHLPPSAETRRKELESQGGRPAFSEKCEASVAVIPLVNLTGDLGQDYFAAGMTEELTNELARFQELRVISCHSTAQMKAKQAGGRETGKRLGARFLLEGGIRKDADTIKISVCLIDTVTGARIWREQFRREPEAQSLIVLQEDIARRVVAAIGDPLGVITAHLCNESRKTSPIIMSTYEAFLRFYYYHVFFSAEAFSSAFNALENAIAEEPESGLAWSLLAKMYAHKYCLGDSQTNATIETAMAMARRGVSLEPRNQMAHDVLTFILFLRNERDDFLREAEVTVALNPNNPSIIGFMGWARALYGDWENGLALLSEGTRLNPYFPGWYRIAPYFDYCRRGCYAEALREARQINIPQLFWDPLCSAAALGHLGRDLEARAEAERLLALRPDLPTCGAFLISLLVKPPSLIETTLAGLRKAGIKICPLPQ